MFEHKGIYQQVGLFGAAAVLVGAATFVGAQRMRQASPIVIQPAATAALPISKPSAGRTDPLVGPVVVHVSGAVFQAGLKKLPAGSRVDDAIRAAGGAKPNANIEELNLAAPLVDGTVVYLPRKGEVAEKVLAPYRGGAAASKIYRADRLPPRAAPTPLSGKLGSGDVAPITLPDIKVEPEGGHRTPKKEAPASPISLNSASIEELQTLPGVGPSTAQKILDYRNEHGSFSSVDELEQVKGIGPKKLEKMRPYLRL